MFSVKSGYFFPREKTERNTYVGMKGYQSNKTGRNASGTNQCAHWWISRSRNRTNQCAHWWISVSYYAVLSPAGGTRVFNVVSPYGDVFRTPISVKTRKIFSVGFRKCRRKNFFRRVTLSRGRVSLDRNGNPETVWGNQSRRRRLWRPNIYSMRGARQDVQTV